MAGKVAFAAQEVSGKRQKEVFARLRRNESRVSRSDSITSLQNRTRTSFWARKPHQRLLRRTPPLKISTDLLTHGIRAETAQKLTPRKRSARPQSAARGPAGGAPGPGAGWWDTPPSPPSAGSSDPNFSTERMRAGAASRRLECEMLSTRYTMNSPP